jgi:hypothetical protein
MKWTIRKAVPAQRTPGPKTGLGPLLFCTLVWTGLGMAVCMTTFLISTIPVSPGWGRLIPGWLSLAGLLLAITAVPLCALIPLPLLTFGRRRLRRKARVSRRWEVAWNAAASGSVAVEATFLFRLARFLHLGVTAQTAGLAEPSWHSLSFAIAYSIVGLLMAGVLIAAGRSGQGAAPSQSLQPLV